VRAIQSGQSSKTLTIAAPRDLTAKWLAARLAAYGRQDPELRFVVLSADDTLDFTQANLDLAICHADAAGEHEGVSLGQPGYVKVGARDGDPRPIGWPGCPAEAKGGGLTVADAGLALDAAAAGLGRATVPVLLAAADLAAGRVAALEERPADRSYWLVAPMPQWRQKKVKALVAALMGRD
jgi:LysR family glycine cleavage system transcriptional activator